MYQTEDDIVKLLKAREPSGLELAIDRFTPNAYSLAYRIIGSLGRHEDIEECVSSVFCEIWNHISEFDIGRGSFKTWVLLKTKYQALEYRRRLAKDLALEYCISDDYHEEGTGEGCSLPQSSGVEAEILIRENLNEIVQAVNQFNDLDRRIFKRRYFLYEDIASIAARYNLTRQAVDNRLLRCRKKLKSIVAINS